MTSLRPILASAWMGIQHDIAWTTPALSVAMRAVAPFASAMTVSIIYWFGTTAGTNTFSPSQLAFVLIGSTLYAHVASYAWVPTVAIAEGKNLSVFPHIYLTSRSTAFYTAGRLLSAFVVSTVTSLAALVAAYYVLGSFVAAQIPIVVGAPSAVLFALALVANIPGALGLGYLLGAYSLYASKFEWSLPGYVAGLLMVFSGALFPTTVLPWPISVAAYYLPFTQFISAARGALLPGSSSGYWYPLGLCLAGGVAFLALGLLVYLAAEKKARRDGVIDRRMA
ncbi:MAG: ABC transporter permease [Nitrososphaerota archaeon]|nr:ABC transporter permease [Nitrososphaerota archaeon]MDG7023361.1 ABC transporter permease [Nitrososphaerota archaeon]